MTDDLPGADLPRRRAGPRVRAFLRPAVLGVLAAVVWLLVAARATDAVLVGLAVFVVAVLATTLGAGDEYLWPEADEDAPDGSRRDVSVLTWTFIGRDGRVSEAAVRRLRADADRRLGRCGVDLPGGLAGVGTGANPPEAEARAHALLGDRTWTALTGHGGWLPSLPDVQHCVEVLERLDGPAPHGPHGRTRS